MGLRAWNVKNSEIYGAHEEAVISTAALSQGFVVQTGLYSTILKNLYSTCNEFVAGCELSSSCWPALIALFKD